MGDEQDIPVDENIERLRLKGTESPPDDGRPEEWQLVRKSLPVVGGAEHNYLALQFVPKNGDEPELMGEIHGVNYNAAAISTKSDGRQVRGSYGSPVIGEGDDLVAIRTKPYEHWGNPATDKNIVLARGDFASIVGGKWKDAQEKAMEVNNTPVVYRFDEQNSNNFARNLLAHIQLEAQSGRWDGNLADYGAQGFNYNPGQWNVRDVFDPAQRVTRDNLRDKSIWSMEQRSINRGPVP